MPFAVALPSFPAIWQRIKSSRFTVLYLGFIVVYAAIQLGLRGQTFVLDSRSSQTLETILVTGRAKSDATPILASDGSIQLCPRLPFTSNYDSCQTAWDPKSDTVHILARQDVSVLSDPVCLGALNYPHYVLHSDLREDVVALCLQIFSLFLTLTALAQNHVSHFISGTVLQLTSVIWAAVRVSDTGKSAAEFTAVISNGACGGSILGNFWSQRWGFDVAILSLDVLGLVLSAAFGLKAAKTFGLTNSSLPQLTPSTNVVYKIMVAALAAIELSLFFCITAGILWVDLLFDLNAMGGLGLPAKVLYALAIILLVPVLFVGWVALHREMWKSILVFLGCAFTYVAGWGLTFALPVFRFYLTTWRLFGVVSILAFVLAFFSFLFALIAAAFFGKGMTLISRGAETPVSPEFHSRSVSSLEKGEYDVEPIDEKVVMVETLPHTTYSKAKATAIARGLTVTPPLPY